MAPGLVLPLDAVTQTFGILSKRGGGKSNTAAVMAEEMFRAELPFVVVDPVGAWWGLRSSSDGKGPGLEVPIFGGHRGDVPLERGGAELVADLIVDESLSCVVDVSAFESETAKREFLATFAERLFRRKGAPGRDAPLHLFLEEADDYAPQRATATVARCLGAFQRIVKQGRARGLGSTMITQRSASLSKDLLTQIETLIVLRTTSPQDRKAIEGWVTYHGQAAEILASLHELAPGEAWVWSPWLDLTKRVQIRRRKTFDSGATPTVAAKKAPATLADVDLEVLRERMAATIERAKVDDPKELRKALADERRRVAELERALESGKATNTPEVVIERVDVPVLTDDQFARLERLVLDPIAKLEGALDRVLEETLKALEPVGKAMGDVEWAATRPPQMSGRGVAERSERALPASGAPTPSKVPRPARQTPSQPGEPVRPAPTLKMPSALGNPDADGITLGKGERTVLGVLRQWPDGRTYNELAFLAAYSAKASTLGVILSKLRQAGYVEPGNQPVRLTAAGLEAAGGYQPLPTGEALLDHWRNHPRMGAGERKVLGVLVAQYPTDLTHDKLCELADYSPIASTMGVILSKLRKLGLVEKSARRLAPEFAEAIGL